MFPHRVGTKEEGASPKAVAVSDHTQLAALQRSQFESEDNVTLAMAHVHVSTTALQYSECCEALKQASASRSNAQASYGTTFPDQPDSVRDDFSDTMSTNLGEEDKNTTNTDVDFPFLIRAVDVQKVFVRNLYMTTIVK